MMRLASAAAAESGEAMNTVPSSSISILTPVSAIILCDDLAAAADDFADLVRVDRERDDARRVGRELGARFAQGFVHFVDDEQAALARLFEGAGQNFAVDALDLHVHLDGGNTVARAGDFKVHIAQEVLETLNVRQDCDIAGGIVLDETHRNARDGLFNRYARIQQCQRACADGKPARSSRLS